MNLSHLRYIVEVAKTGSITKAGQNLYIGQPNLSKAIREMEKYMGTAIFKRTSKGVVPTEKGNEIIERAKALLKSAEDFESDFCDKKNKTERIFVGICGSEYCIDIIEEAAAEWAGENISFEYFRCDRERLFEMIKNGQLSFGVVRLVKSKEDIAGDLMKTRTTHQLLAEGRGLAALNKKSAQAQKESVSPLDLKALTEICGSETRSGENQKGIGVSDRLSGEKIIEKNSGCFSVVSSHDKQSKNIIYKEMVPLVEIYDMLIYSEDKRFGAREKELIKRISHI